MVQKNDSQKIKKSKNKKNFYIILIFFIFICITIFLIISQYKNKEIKIIKQEKEIITEKYIFIDLKKMILELRHPEKETEIINILSKGKPGSYYETPAGEYKIKYKNKNHFSSLGEVYMPYSLQFYANFFIHGVPYYPNDQKVSSDYSGGCIRLKDEDAKKVYEFADIGTKVKIINQDTINASNIKIDKNQASTILTLLVVLEAINQEKIINYKNKNIPFKNILQDIANNDKDAIDKIYSEINKNTFENLKLEKAKALGIENINFENEIDRKIILNYIANNKIFIFKYLKI